mmetsp:Transcript_36055/g.65180  ORF Transcript_36055/g.65180 Transcript_36055/m.65180 type:complete len:256 (+) Transcript_36055:418-1185(+)
MSEDGIYGPVEVLLRLLVGLVDRRFQAPQPSLLPLGNHVGPTHQLGSESPALLPGANEVALHTAVHALQVRLIGVEHRWSIPLVVLALHVQHDVVDGRLDISPLGIDHYPYSKVLSQIQDVLNPLDHVHVELQLLLVQGRPVKSTLLPAAADKFVDAREPHSVRPLNVADLAALISVDGVENSPHILLAVYCEELAPPVMEGVKVHHERPVDGVEGCQRLQVLRRAVVGADPLEESAGLHQARRHALEQNRVPQA